MWGQKGILMMAFKVIDDPDFRLWYTRSKAQAWLYSSGLTLLCSSLQICIYKFAFVDSSPNATGTFSYGHVLLFPKDAYYQP